MKSMVPSPEFPRRRCTSLLVCIRWRRENRNVRWILAIVAFAGLSESLEFGAALASYLYISTGESNLKVGYLESAMDITELLTALPVGDLAGYTYSLFYLSRILS